MKKANQIISVMHMGDRGFDVEVPDAGHEECEECGSCKEWVHDHTCDFYDDVEYGETVFEFFCNNAYQTAEGEWIACQGRCKVSTPIQTPKYARGG